MSVLRKRNSIIFLLGAGASYEANIPISAVMISKLEELLNDDDNSDFPEHYPLYYYIRSAIQYGYEIKRINKQAKADSFYNIESLVVSLEELAKKDEHHLYPFIGAWNPKLTELTDKNFENIKRFRNKIVGKVRDWVDLERRENADYYKGLIEFYEDYQHPLRIFNLNYDLCVEYAHQEINGNYPERGFYSRKEPDPNKVRKWNWQLLDDSLVENESKAVLLYKLHGSLDWKRHEDGQLTFEDSVHSIKSNESSIIFGTSYKLQYYDPFLYLFQEFRKWSLRAKLIISIGYGFADDHINGILGQALNSDPEMKLLWVSPIFAPPDKIEEIKQQEVAKLEKSLKLNICDAGKIVRWNCGAKEFMTNQLTIENLEKLFPVDDDPFPVVKLDEDFATVTIV